jgi:hypothetical protein
MLILHQRNSTKPEQPVLMHVKTGHISADEYTRRNYSGIRSQVEQTCKHISRATPVTMETSCIYTFTLYAYVGLYVTQRSCVFYRTQE